MTLYTVVMLSEFQVMRSSCWQTIISAGFCWWFIHKAFTCTRSFVAHCKNQSDEIFISKYVFNGHNTLRVMRSSCWQTYISVGFCWWYIQNAFTCTRGFVAHWKNQSDVIFILKYALNGHSSIQAVRSACHNTNENKKNVSLANRFYKIVSSLVGDPSEDL